MGGDLRPRPGHAGDHPPGPEHDGQSQSFGKEPGRRGIAFPPAVRKIIYTTNAIESVNARLRKIIKTRGHFPSDDAASKLIWLALRNITAEWKRPAMGWRDAMNQFAILYAERFTRPTP